MGEVESGGGSVWVGEEEGRGGSVWERRGEEWRREVWVRGGEWRRKCVRWERREYVDEESGGGSVGGGRGEWKREYVDEESGGGSVWGGRGEWRRECVGWERRRMEEGVYGRGEEESGGGSVWGVGEEKESGGDGRSVGCRREEDRGVQGECKKDERNMGHKGVQGCVGERFASHPSSWEEKRSPGTRLERRPETGQVKRS